MIPKQYHLHIPASTERNRESCLASLYKFLETLYENGQRIIKLHISTSGQEKSPAFLQSEIRRALGNLFPFRDLPAITAVAQAPCGDIPLQAEIWSIDRSVQAESFLFRDLVHVRLQDRDILELWSSGFHTDYGQGGTAGHPNLSTVQTAAYRNFSGISALLGENGFGFDDIFRQWNYIGHILEIREEHGKKIQNYQAFNEIRGIFYQRKRNRTQYPAATGIGMDYPGICIDLVAIRPLKPSIANLPLRSPVQADAFRYGQECLIGDIPETETRKTDEAERRKEPPLFERGRCLFDKDNPFPCPATVSGTASIIGQETIDKGNAAKQLENTLSFIDQLALHGISKKESLSNASRDFHYDRARLYVKPGIPSRELTGIFRSRYPHDCPCSVVEAEICRNDLLVEIEADFHYRAIATEP